MAGRTPKPRAAKPAPSGVEDSESFAFLTDAPLSIAPAPRTRKSKPAAAEKPHYHGHRERLRERFAQSGPEALADYELLELMLFRSIPRQDTKPVAKALLQRFGTLSGVLAAEPQRIAEISGVGPAVAQDLKIAHAVHLRAQRAELARRTVITSWTQLTNYVREALQHEPREQFRALFLDVKNQLLADEVQNVGTIDHAPVYPREIARRALELSAGAVILVHNHPSGDPKPSAQDIAITREVIKALDAIAVRVHDHLIVGREGVASFKSLGLI